MPSAKVTFTFTKAASAIAAAALTLCLIFSCTTAPLPEESHVGNIRYWKEDSKVLGLKAMTVSGDQLVDHDVPERTDPKIVILMYHNLVFGRTGNEYNRDIYNFEHDLAFIRSRFKIIDFVDLLAVREGRMKLTSDVAMITFDDGDLSMYAIAYPLLKEYGIKATFFLISGFVGEIGYMGWSQIREIAQYRDASGNKLFTMGSHGVSHKFLGEVDQSTLVKELVDSKFAIEENSGEPVEILALPFGSGAGRKDITQLARNIGYRAIRTSDDRFVPAESFDLYRLPGIYIDNISTDKAMQKIWSMIGR
jgi:peptidoglycan/xylan/chitin deacetylase (PgdA/CDA1 family)